MASGVYTAYLYEAVLGLTDWDTNVITCDLMDTNHTYDVDDDVWGDVSANELSAGGGYPNGDSNVLQNAAASKDDTDNEAVLDADDISWTSATFSAFHAVIWDDTSATDVLVCSIDFGGEQQVTSGTFTIQWATEGIVNLAPT